MVVKVGKEGSICFYWRDVYISSIAVHDNHQDTFQYYFDYYRGSLTNALRHRKIKKIIDFCYLGLDTYLNRKISKKKMDMEDHVSFQMVMFFLLIFKKIEFDDVILFCPRKKSKDYKKRV